ncbi:MerR family transcriptional regulator [Leucobacter sp. GX24907]
MSDQVWSIQEVTKSSGITSRALRHYQRVGLLEPSRTGAAGQRFYDAEALLRLQRILVLRGLGLGLQEIRRVLERPTDIGDALRHHVEELEQERARLATIAGSVRTTIAMIEAEGELVAEKMFEGFDHTQHREEVEERWGADAYESADTWWNALGADAQELHRSALNALVNDFAGAARRGLDVHSDDVQRLAARQFEWVRAGWGGTPPSAEAFTGLGEMYVADPRFGAVYSADGESSAAYVRDAMAVYAKQQLT